MIGGGTGRGSELLISRMNQLIVANVQNQKLINTLVSHIAKIENFGQGNGMKIQQITEAVRPRARCT